MGDIAGLYQVVSFLLGRNAYTHELGYYGKQVAAAIRVAHPDLPCDEDFAHVSRKNVHDVLAEWEGKFGKTFELSDSLKDILADERDAVSTLREMRPDADITIVKI